MSCSTRIKIGSSLLITVTAEDEKDLFEQASLWSELPCACGRCKGQNLGLRFRRHDSYDFYELVCKDCRATYALGQKKEGGGLYPRGNKETGEWDEEYRGEDKGRGETRRGSYRDDDRRSDRGRDSRPRERQSDRLRSEVDDDDIPF